MSISYTEIDSDTLFKKKSFKDFISQDGRFYINLSKENILSSDSRSFVVNCRDNITEKKSILKILNKKTNIFGDELIPLKLNHPNVINYIWMDKNPSLVFLYMKKYDCDLIDFLFHEKHANIQKIFKQMCDAVEYLHSHFISHFDIKLENFLVDLEHGYIILTDFGFAVEWNEPEPLVSTFKGSPCYISPEIISKKLFLMTKPDIWALGICLFAMLVGKFPFDEDEPRISLKLKKIEYPANISTSLKNIIEKILIEDFLERPSIQKIQEWLK